MISHEAETDQRFFKHELTIRNHIKHKSVTKYLNLLLQIYYYYNEYQINRAMTDSEHTNQILIHFLNLKIFLTPK